LKHFIDLEFNEDGKDIDIISLAIVSERGKELYLKNSSANFERCGDWVKENVIPNLGEVSVTKVEGKLVVVRGQNFGRINKQWYPFYRFKDLILQFIGADSKPEFWSEWGAYDWVGFCRCFGAMIDLPEHFPMYVNDLRTILSISGENFKFENNYDDCHRSIDDARILKKRFEEISNVYLLNLQHKWE
jgi:hypothetical protein